jgi:importin subunit beta-1
MSIADTSMQCLLQIISAKSSVATEEALFTAGKLMDKIEGHFARYLDALMPFLIQGVQNSAEFQICSASVGCIGDLCRAVEGKILPYCDTIVQCLLQALENSSLKRDVKPPMLSLFGDMALAIGPNFRRYLEPTLRMLYQASNTSVDLENMDLVDYMNELYEGIIEAYTGIVNGLADGDAAPVLLQVLVGPNVNALGGMCEFFVRIPTSAPEDEVLRGATGLLGDLAKSIGKPAAPFLTQQAVGPLLNLCSKIQDEDGNFDQKSQEMFSYAQKELTAIHR